MVSAAWIGYSLHHRCRGHLLHHLSGFSCLDRIGYSLHHRCQSHLLHHLSGFCCWDLIGYSLHYRCQSHLLHHLSGFSCWDWIGYSLHHRCRRHLLHHLTHWIGYSLHHRVSTSSWNAGRPSVHHRRPTYFILCVVPLRLWLCLPWYRVLLVGDAYAKRLAKPSVVEPSSSTLSRLRCLCLANMQAHIVPLFNPL